MLVLCVKDSADGATEERTDERVQLRPFRMQRETIIDLTNGLQWYSYNVDADRLAAWGESLCASGTAVAPTGAE